MSTNLITMMKNTEQPDTCFAVPAETKTPPGCGAEVKRKGDEAHHMASLTKSDNSCETLNITNAAFS